MILAALILAQTATLEPFAESPKYQWNGIAILPDGRKFAGFPRQSGPETISMGEIRPDGTIRPYPGGGWNDWSPEDKGSAEGKFVNVNAVFADSTGGLWAVDGGSYAGRRVPGGPKLVRIDPRTDRVTRVYAFDLETVPPGAVLNDVRIGATHAFLTESGQGSLVTIDLTSGKATRRLKDHPSTKGERNRPVYVEGRKLRDEKGEEPVFNANNLELTPDGKILLYRPSFAPRWSQIAVVDLLDDGLSEEELGERVQPGNETPPLGGTTMDRAGNIYLMDLERRAIWRQALDGTTTLVLRDDRVLWGDASAIGPDGFLYVPMSQNERIPPFNGGIDDAVRPFRIFRVKL